MSCSYLHQFYTALGVLSHPFASKTEDQQCCIVGNRSSPAFLCNPKKMVRTAVFPHPHPSAVSLLWLLPLSLSFIPILFGNMRLDHKKPSSGSRIIRGRGTSLHSVTWPQHLRWTIMRGHPCLLSQPSQTFVSNFEKYVLSCQQMHWLADESVAMLDVKLSGLLPCTNAEDQQILWTSRQQPIWKEECKYCHSTCLL